MLSHCNDHDLPLLRGEMETIKLDLLSFIALSRTVRQMDLLRRWMDTEMMGYALLHPLLVDAAMETMGEIDCAIGSRLGQLAADDEGVKVAPDDLVLN